MSGYETTIIVNISTIYKLKWPCLSLVTQIYMKKKTEAENHTLEVHMDTEKVPAHVTYPLLHMITHSL